MYVEYQLTNVESLYIFLKAVKNKILLLVRHLTVY